MKKQIIILALLFFSQYANSQTFPFILYMHGPARIRTFVGEGIYEQKNKIRKFSGNLKFIPCYVWPEFMHKPNNHSFLVNYNSRKECYKVQLNNIQEMALFQNKDTLQIKRLDKNLICRNLFSNFYDEDIFNFNTNVVKYPIYCLENYQQYPYKLIENDKKIIFALWTVNIKPNVFLIMQLTFICPKFIKSNN